MNQSTIVEALKKLDSTNDNHWTQDGLPRLETLKFMTSDQTLTRDVVTSALPGFSRATPNPEPPAPILPTPIVTEVSDASLASDQDAGDPQTQSEKAEADLAEALEVARERMAEASAAKTKADQAYASAVAEVDKIVLLIEKDTNKNSSFQSALTGYQQQLAKRREERVAQMNALAKLPFKITDLVPVKAAIDTALARKTTRGTQRPKV